MKIFINIIRYLASCFFLLGFFIYLSKQINLAITFLVFAISLAPFVYQLIFKNSEISNKAKIIIQIVVPIIAFFVMSIIVGFTSK